MNPYAPMFQAHIPTNAASTASQQLKQQPRYDDDDDNHHDGPVADEDQEGWIEGAEHGAADHGSGGVAYWDAHGQQPHLQHHHHAGFAGGGYGQYDGGAYHPDGYDYHQVWYMAIRSVMKSTENYLKRAEVHG